MGVFGKRIGLWYNTATLNNIQGSPTSRKCNDCGSDLILVEEVTMTLGNNLYPITKSTYKCSNQKCQDEADKRNAKRLELKNQQEQARKERIQENLKLKQQAASKV